MKIIDKYITKNLLISFLFTLTIFTFVLFTGTLFKIIQLFLGKIDLLFVGKFFLFSIPYLLSYSIPMAFLTANLLVFGQLSAEREITALKACGVNIFRIIVYPVLLSFVLTFFCVVINDMIIPICHYELRRIRTEISTKSPEALIEAGVMIDYFENYLMYIDESDGKNLKNIFIQQYIPNEPTRFIKAEHGTFDVDVVKKHLLLKLYNVLVEQQGKEKDNSGMPTFIHARMGSVPLELPLDAEHIGRKSAELKRIKDYSIRELLNQIRDLKIKMKTEVSFDRETSRKKISKMETEINTRLSLAFSCLALLFIGVSLGIRTHRSEKTVGIPISMVLFAIHYGFTLFGKAFDSNPGVHPELIVWFPNICLGILGIVLMYRISYR